MQRDLAKEKFSFKFHQPTGKFQYVSVEGDMTLDEARSLNDTIQIAFESNGNGIESDFSPKPVEKTEFNTKEPEYTPGIDVKKPTNELPDLCKYCGSKVYDNRENKFDKPDYKPRMKCMSKQCGAMYFTNDSNWWKPAS